MEHLLLFLQEHQQLAYGVLLFGTYIETVFPFSLFIYGEVFLLAGPILAGLGILDIWTVTLVFYIGGIAGDTTSYCIGRRYGASFFTHFQHNRWVGKLFSEKNYGRGLDFFKKQGTWSIFFARLSGPFSWITPALAGIFKVPYRQFALYNIPGVLLGIGEYIIIGYFFADNYKQILAFIQKYTAGALTLLLLLFLVWHRIRSFYGQRTIKGM